MFFKSRVNAVEKFSCEGCGGDCCRDMIMPLKDKEAEWMRENGSKLNDIPEGIQEALNVPKGKKLYSLVGACGLLDETSGLCTAYGQRPETCSNEINPGDRLCLEVRAERGFGPVALPMPVIRTAELV